MDRLKPLSRDAIQPALMKAERYRLLNEPAEAESICRDVLDVEPNHQQALVVLLLALTDQFGEHASGAAQEADEILRRLVDDYERAYYSGIVRERRAKALLNRGGPGTASSVYEWLREAMAYYERAEALRPAGNDDAILRWNTCARILMRNPHLEPAAEERAEPQFLE
jgi:tetratricopeptide (TPR) repeat protein